MRFSRCIFGALPVGALVTVLAACGSSGASTPAAPGGGATSAASSVGATSGASNGAEPPAALVKAAQEEGSVVFYSSLNTDVLQRLAAAFKAKYGITLAWKDSASGATIAATTAQLDAGNVQIDVISITPDPAFDSEYASDLMTFSPSQLPALKGMPAGEVSPNFVQDQLNYYGWVYNTDEVKASDLPSTLYGLASDSALAGKIGTTDIAASNSYATYHAMLYDQWGTAKWNTWIKGLLGTEHALVGTSSAALANQVASGAVAIFGPTHLGIVSALIKQGAPLAIKYYDPVMQLPDGLMSFNKSPHPDAAKVFVNWMVSAQAQSIICGDEDCASYLNLPGTIQKPTGVNILEAPVARGNALDDSLTKAFKAASS
jgi:iron(III) transport system substrate-binding protein